MAFSRISEEEIYMTTNLLIAGFGGQGVMTIGKMIGECAFVQNLNVTFLPSYGPEQRGGTANCTVVLSDEPVGSPAAESLDVLCVLNQPSLDKFLPMLKPNGQFRHGRCFRHNPHGYPSYRDTGGLHGA